MPKEPDHTKVADAIASAFGVRDILPEIFEAISSNANPEEVFTEEQLADWATENGYTKLEANPDDEDGE